MNLVTRCVLRLIRLYQRHVSPRKGYACAHRVVYGGRGCSEVGYRLIRRYGVWQGWRVLQRRFSHCRYANDVRRKRQMGFATLQRGDCDCSPDCDVGLGDVWDWGSGCIDCDCGGEGDKKKPKQSAATHFDGA